MSSLCGRLLLCAGRRGARGLQTRRERVLGQSGPSYPSTVAAGNCIAQCYGRRYSSGGGGEGEESAADKIDPGLRLGDYPVLPWRSAQLNKHTGWWDNQDRRDKETPLHEEEDALSVWMYDAVENNGIFTRWEALAQFTAIFGVLGLIIFLSYLYDAPSRNPAVPRQFPYDNLYLERGGDPSRRPNDEEMAEKVKAAYGNEYSA